MEQNKNKLKPLVPRRSKRGTVINFLPPGPQSAQLSSTVGPQLPKTWNSRQFLATRTRTRTHARAPARPRPRTRTRTHTRTRTRTRTRTLTRTHARTQAHSACRAARAHAQPHTRTRARRHAHSAKQCAQHTPATPSTHASMHARTRARRHRNWLWGSVTMPTLRSNTPLSTTPGLGENKRSGRAGHAAPE